MLGIWRFLLAVMVLLGHGYSPVSSYFGIYAVDCFYVLSGYLITLVLHEKYRGVRGRIAFVKNRFLRLYPTYWVSLIVTIGVGRIAGWDVGAGLPKTPAAWARELTFVGIDFGNGPHLIGQSWTVWIELFFYGMMALGLSARWWLSFLWLAVSIAIHLGFLRTHDHWWEHAYITRAGCSLPFAIGAAGYWVSRLLAKIADRGFQIADRKKTRKPNLRSAFINPQFLSAALIAAMVLHACFAYRIWGDPYIRGFYASMLIGGLVVTASHRNKPQRPRWLAHLDKWLGDVTYPLYLIHISALQIAGALLRHPELPQNRLGVSVAGLAIAVAMSAVIWLLVDRPIARMRNRVRVGAAVGD